MKYREVPWKHNLRKVPDLVRHKLRTLGDQPVTVGVRLSVPRKSIEDGTLQHLGISLVDGEVQLRDAVVIPPADMGRWSRTNIDGNEVVRKDLPMVTRTSPVEVPNWGDWYNGSHYVD